MEHDGPLPCSQEFASDPCPEADESSLNSTHPFFKIDFNITFPATNLSFKWSLFLRFSHYIQCTVCHREINAVLASNKNLSETKKKQTSFGIQF
jgi:hypothetical protein